jgi:hypothetical protein
MGPLGEFLSIIDDAEQRREIVSAAVALYEANAAALRDDKQALVD